MKTIRKALILSALAAGLFLGYGGAALAGDMRDCVTSALTGASDGTGCRAVATLVETPGLPKAPPKGVQLAAGDECPANSNAWCPDEAPDCKYDGDQYFCCKSGWVGCVGGYCCESGSYCCGGANEKKCCK